MKIKKLVLLTLLMGLASCGGGGSSSDTVAASPAEPTVQDGTYLGTQNITLSFAGVSQSTGDTPLTITVSNGQVNILGVSTPLSGSNFALTGSASGAQDGVSCTFTFNYVGSFSNGNASGTISGPAICNGLNFTMTGVFSTSSFTRAKSSSTDSITSLTEAASKLIQ